jgi:diacylglycerol kinase (ATP)
MDSQRGHIVVFNPRAGRRRAHEALRQVTTRLDGKIATVIETSVDGTFGPHVRESVQIVRDEIGGRPVIIAIGGDGTLSMTLNALADAHDATLAVVPAGSGNDFAAAVGIPGIDAALDALERNAMRDVDFGIVNGRRFANCVGMGLDAEVGSLAARLRKRGYPPGPSYYAAALAGLFIVKPVGIRVASGGATHRFERGVMVTVGNGHSYGGGFRGAPGALLDDGALDAYVFSDVEGLLPRLALMQRIRAGTHAGAPNVLPMRTASLVVEFDREVAMHVDGELDVVRRADISVVARGLRVIGA